MRSVGVLVALSLVGCASRAGVDGIGDDSTDTTSGAATDATSDAATDTASDDSTTTGDDSTTTGDDSTDTTGDDSTDTTGDDSTDTGDDSTESIAVQVITGDQHTCAVMLTGRIRCWGDNWCRYLGYPNDDWHIGDNEDPASAGDIDVGGGAIVAAAAGNFHTCALLKGGAVRCWGSMLFTPFENFDEPPSSADDVDVGGPVIAIAARGYRTCVIMEGGGVRCWGRGSAYDVDYGVLSGPLGYGNEEELAEPASAGDIDVGGPAVALAVGDTHTCVVLEGGSVRCWGAAFSNESGFPGAHDLPGRLGYGNNESIGDDETPASAGDVDVGGSVVALAAGLFHTCALLDGGTVRCWGAAALGYGNGQVIGDDEAPATAGDVPLGGSAIAIGAGSWHTCAILEDGHVRCWGSGQRGKLGYGNVNDVGYSNTPADVGDVEVGGTAIAIAGGFSHTCALVEGSVIRCWGFGEFGQLGYGNELDIGDDETPASAGDVHY
jgi:alpha-tubulin suppressor-like RCC1 family protein